MRDVRLLELLERQWNRASLAQMEALGYTRLDVNRRVAAGRLRAVHEAVFAGRPFLDDLRGTWMAATLTAPESYVSHASSAALHGFWDRRRQLETVTRPGSGGPRRLDGLFVYRSLTLAGNTTSVDGIPTTTAERAIIEMAHQDIGEDARKEAVWSAAGWCVLRAPSEVVYDAPEQLVALAPPARTSVT